MDGVSVAAVEASMCRMAPRRNLRTCRLAERYLKSRCILVGRVRAVRWTSGAGVLGERRCDCPQACWAEAVFVRWRGTNRPARPLYELYDGCSIALHGVVILAGT